MARRRREQKGINKKVLIGLGFVLIMVLSSFGVMIYSGTSSTRYKSWKFSQEQAGWSAKIEGKTRMFLFHPLDVEDLAFNSTAITGARMLYFVFEPESRIVSSVEIARLELNSAFAEKGIYMVPAIASGSDLYSLPIVTCQNATSSVPVVYITQSNRTSASWRGNCLVLEAYDEFSVPRLKDRLLYALYGVI